MQKTLIKHPSPHLLSLSQNPEYYWHRFASFSGMITIWSLISLARLLHNAECRTSLGAYLIFGISVLVPGIVCGFLYHKYKTAKKGQVIEFNQKDRTIFFTGGVFFHFEEVKQVQVKKYTDVEDGDSYTIYLKLKNGNKLEIETFDTYHETKSVVQSVARILKLPITGLWDDGQIRLSLGMKRKLIIG